MTWLAVLIVPFAFVVGLGAGIVLGARFGARLVLQHVQASAPALPEAKAVSS